MIYSRDVQWLNKLWGEYYKVSPEDHLKSFMDPLEGPEDQEQEEPQPPHVPNIEGNMEENT